MSLTTSAASTPVAKPRRRALVIGAPGVVYGDIGTSPIYTLRECLKAAGSSATFGFAIDQRSHQEAAEIMGVEVATAKTRLFRARAHLSSMMDGTR